MCGYIGQKKREITKHCHSICHLFRCPIVLCSRGHPMFVQASPVRKGWMHCVKGVHCLRRLSVRLSVSLVESTALYVLQTTKGIFSCVHLPRPRLHSPPKDLHIRPLFSLSHSQTRLDKKKNLNHNFPSPFGITLTFLLSFLFVLSPSFS